MTRTSIVLVLVVLALALAACDTHTTATASTAAPNQLDAKQAKLLATAVSADVMTQSKNWNADPENDGIIVYPNLKDDNDHTVLFTGVTLPVEITIYTLETDDNYREVQGRNIYSGNGTIDSWKDGNFLYSGGIRVAYTDMTTQPADRDYGRLYATIHTPDGKNFTAKTDLVNIRAS
ncbi:MAG TPA: hypothetical protein VGK29_03080 [Paludibaculum sp.]|jgi:hypothetical protein